MVCAFQPGHPIGANHEISEDLIRSYPLICYETDTRFGSLLRREFFNKPPSEGSIEVQYSYTACLLAEAGLGVALVDSFTSIHGSRYKIEVRPLRPSVSVDAYAIYQKSRAPKRLVRAFIDHSNWPSPNSREVVSEMCGGEHASGSLTTTITHRRDRRKPGLAAIADRSRASSRQAGHPECRGAHDERPNGTAGPARA